MTYFLSLNKNLWHHKRFYELSKTVKNLESSVYYRVSTTSLEHV